MRESGNLTCKVRTLSTVAAFVSGVFLVVYLLDTRYRLLPQSIHSALPLHHDGFVVTDLRLKECSAANPFTTCRLDPDTWHRIDKDLYLNSGWVKSAFLHVRRKKEEYLEKGEKVVMDVRVSRTDPGAGEKGKKSPWESRKGGIWLLRSDNRHDPDSNNAVTGVDIIFGPDAVDPRPSWTLAQNALTVGSTQAHREPRLSIRHGVPKQMKKTTPPRVNKDGKFKILQVSDLHLSTGLGACRDALDAKGEVKGKCEADSRTLDFVSKIIDEEKPDMAVLSGDQVNGDTAPDVQTALYKAIDLFASRHIPYASIFGNHDDEGKEHYKLSREIQMQILSTMPYNLARAGPSDVDGTGNYYVQILGASGSTHAALTLYFLDTHSYSPDEKTYSGYDWIKPSQVEWFRDTAHKLQPINDKYTRIHLNMAFIHIPLPEFIMQNNTYAGGEVREASTAPKFNTDFHAALREEGVVAVGCGHDHVNDACALRPQVKSSPVKRAVVPQNEDVGASSGSLETAAVEDVSVSGWHTKQTLGPWMCYAGGSGFGGYAGHGGYHRRVRVWDIDTNTGRIITWTRLECCGADTKGRHSELTIVDEGKVIAPITDDD